MNDRVRALGVYNDGSTNASALYAGGYFTDSPAGDSYLARLQGCPVESFNPDLNGDGVVDVSDLLILFSAWGPCADPSACAADLNGDEVVDVMDLSTLLRNWG